MAIGIYSRVPSRKSPSSTFIHTVLIISTFLILILLALGILSIPSTSGNSSPKANGLTNIIHNQFRGRAVGGGDLWEPRAFVYHNFLTQEECNHLIEIAKPSMQKSTVVDTATGKRKDSRARTSSGTILERGCDKTIREIEKRIADFTFLPVEHGEGLQVLHYEVGQKYEPHHDYFIGKWQRIATVLMYLSDVEEGGETVFPAAEGNISSVPWWNELSECGKGGLSVKPKMGDALLFWSMKPDGSMDSLSLHGGCPVIRGNKWSATKWIHANEHIV